ncbi:hypothetical protein ACHAWF_003891, partial [Thalassiosira exigua]
PSSRRDVLSTAASAAFGLSALVALDPPEAARAASFRTGPVTPQSAANKAAESYQGVYTDPNHPEGYRVVMASGGGKAIMTLSDEGGIDAETYKNVPVGPTLSKVGRGRPWSGFRRVDIFEKLLSLSSGVGDSLLVADLCSPKRTSKAGQVAAIFIPIARVDVKGPAAVVLAFDGVFSTFGGGGGGGVQTRPLVFVPLARSSPRLLRRLLKDGLVRENVRFVSFPEDLCSSLFFRYGIVSNVHGQGKEGGPKGVVAKLSEDKQTITFPDGNTWTKNSNQYDGVYKDPNHPKGYRVVRKFRGATKDIRFLAEVNDTGDAKDSKFVAGSYDSLLAIPAVAFTFYDYPGYAGETGGQAREKATDIVSYAMQGGFSNDPHPNETKLVGQFSLEDKNPRFPYGTITFPDGTVWTRI